MRVRFVVALLAAAAMTPMAAQAQNHATQDAAGGAAAGAAVAGPVGAAVGAAVGGTVGAAGDVAHAVLAPPPPPVITYVEREDVPSVTVEKEVVVGEPLPPHGDGACDSAAPGATPTRSSITSASSSIRGRTPW